MGQPANSGSPEKIAVKRLCVIVVTSHNDNHNTFQVLFLQQIHPIIRLSNRKM